MASPFSKYTGEQIQPINYLPYTGEMARQRYEAISGLGKGLAEAIKNYQQTKQERETMADVAAGVISNFVTQDFQNPEDKTVYMAKPDAPMHHQDLIKEALKAGDGDIGAGLAAMPVSKLRAWNALHAKYESDVRFETEVALKRGGLNIQEQDLAFRRQQAKDDLEFRGKQAKALEEQQKEENRLKAQALSIQRKEFKQKQREAKKAEAQRELVSEIDSQEVSPFGTLVQQITVTQRVGDIFDTDGNLIVRNVDIEDAIEALGLPRDKVLTKEDASKTIISRQEEIQDFAIQKVGSYFAGGNPTFSLKDDFPTAVQKGYAEQFIRTSFKQANALSVKLYGKELEGLGAYFPEGLEGRMVNGTGAFALAKKFASKPQMVDEVKKQGINVVPENIAFDKLYVTSVQSEKQIVKEEKTEVPLDDLAVFKARYDALQAKSNKRLPFSFEQLVDTLPSRFVRVSQVRMGDGTVQRVIRNGTQIAPVSSLRQSADAATTQAQFDRQSQDLWVRRFNKPVKVGPLTIQSKGGAESFAGDWKTDYPLLTKGLEDISQISSIANEMRKFVNKGPLQKVLDAQGMKRFEDLVARAKTFRTNFIATGQETEADNERLTNIVGGFDVKRLAFKDVHMQAIDAFEQIVRDKVTARFRNANFLVDVGQAKRYSQAEIRKIANELENTK